MPFQFSVGRRDISYDNIINKNIVLSTYETMLSKF